MQINFFDGNKAAADLRILGFTYGTEATCADLADNLIAPMK